MTDDHSITAQIRSALAGPYRDAVRAHLEYEVFAGQRNKKALQEFEAALAHLFVAVVDADESQIPHALSHCQRVAIETTEYVAESLLESIRQRFDPYYRHPWLSRILLLSKPSFLDQYYEELRDIQEHVRKARSLKGRDVNYAACLDEFKIAVEKGKLLDKKTPGCPFGERAFAVALAVAMLILGYFVGRIH